MADDTGETTRRIALLGLGAAARDIHLPACREVAGVRITAGADPDDDARRAFSRLAPKVALYADPVELLREQRPDWAVVAAPPLAHRSLCLAAVEHGAHVFCEKPFVPSARDADAILDAAASAGRQVAVNFEFPRMPIFEAAQRAIGTSDFGRPLFLQAWQHMSEREAASGWRSARQTMQEFGSHVVDLAVQLFGGLPERVSAHMPRFAGSRDADLVDVVTLEFPDGRLASIVLDRVCRGSHRYLELRLDGERASLRASIGGRARLSLFLAARGRRPGARLELARGGQAWLEVGEKRRVLARNPLDAFADATARHFASVLAAVERAEEPPASARYARSIALVVEAAYSSARNGHSVVLAREAKAP